MYFVLLFVQACGTGRLYGVRRTHTSSAAYTDTVKGKESNEMEKPARKDKYSFLNLPIRYVNTGAANFRAIPNGRILGIMFHRTELRSQVFKKDAKWIKVTVVGWIWKASADTDTTDEVRYVNVEKEKFRGTPNGKKIGQLLRGSRLAVLQEKSNWIQVTIEGWIWRKLTSTSKPPVMSKPPVTEKQAPVVGSKKLTSKEISDDDLRGSYNDGFLVYLENWNVGIGFGLARIKEDPDHLYSYGNTWGIHNTLQKTYSNKDYDSIYRSSQNISTIYTNLFFRYYFKGLTERCNKLTPYIGFLLHLTVWSYADFANDQMDCLYCTSSYSDIDGGHALYFTIGMNTFSRKGYRPFSGFYYSISIRLTPGEGTYEEDYFDTWGVGPSGSYGPDKFKLNPIVFNVGYAW